MRLPRAAKSRQKNEGQKNRAAGMSTRSFFCPSFFCRSCPVHHSGAEGGFGFFRCVLDAITVLIILAANTSAARADERTEQDKQVDAAIAKALEHIAGKQLANGSWSIDQFGESTSATSLAVMAFLAAGHVPGEGPYDQHMQRGIRWVLDHQQSNGLLVHRTGTGPMYCHGISTLMLAEVAGMTDDALSERCRDALTKAVRVILSAQDVRKDRNNAGGWRYQPTSNDSDLSVTGWQLLALRAAKDIGSDVPAENIDQAVEYVKRCSYQRSGFGYQPGGAPTQTRTGTGILALEICGVHHSPEAISGAEYLVQNPLRADSEFFFYGVYYGTIGMFQMGDEHWNQTKRHIVPLLLSLQSPDGSWSGRHGGERGLGTVYATSLAVLALSVEYQFLPIYQR
jgi:prenyltransferase/squalene oxidase-like repeat protein